MLSLEKDERVWVEYLRSDREDKPIVGGVGARRMTIKIEKKMNHAFGSRCFR